MSKLKTIKDVHIPPTEFELEILLRGGSFYPSHPDGREYKCFYSNVCGINMAEAKRVAGGGCVIHKGGLPKSGWACDFCAKKQKDNPNWLCYYENERLCSREYKSAVQPICICSSDPVPGEHIEFTCMVTDPLIFSRPSNSQRYDEALDRAEGGCIIHKGEWIVQYEYACDYCLNKKKTDRYWLCYYQDEKKCSKEPAEARQVKCSCNK